MNIGLTTLNQNKMKTKHMTPENHVDVLSKAMEEKNEEVYELTFKGLLCSITHDDELVKNLMDRIELYLRRHYSKNGHPAIVFNLDENMFEFVTLQKSE